MTAVSPDHIDRIYKADFAQDQCGGHACIVIIMIMASISPHSPIFCMTLPYLNLFPQQK